MRVLNSLMLLSLIITMTTSCGKKNAKAKTDALTTDYTLNPFEDVNNKSTLNLATLTNIPQHLDLKDQMTSVKDQGSRGTCSFFAAIALVESAIKRNLNIDVNLSEEYLNYVVKNSGISDDQEGGYPEENLDVAINKNLGFLQESDWPYQPSYFGVKDPCIKISTSDAVIPKVCITHNSPSEKILANKISGDNFKELLVTTDTTNEAIETLAKYQEPMTIVLPVNTRGWGESGDASYTEEMRQECIDMTGDCGLHVVVLTGYDISKQVFFFKNSWGKKWGHSGYGTIPFSVVDRHAKLIFTRVEVVKDISALKSMKQNNSDETNVNNFDIKAIRNEDNSLRLKLTGKINNINKKAISISSTIVAMDIASKELPSIQNTTEILITEDEMKDLNSNYNVVYQRNYIFPSEDQLDLIFDESNSIEQVFSAKQLKIKSLVEKISDRSKKIYIRTSIYQISDEDGYKLLYRVFN